MKLYRTFILFAFLGALLFVATGCEDAAEDALEDATGYDWDFGNDEANAPDVDDWTFLFAVNLEKDSEAELLDNDFEVDLSLIKDLVNLDGIDYQVVFAKVEEVDGSNMLRFANKVVIDGGKMKMDGEAKEKYGSSVGPAGTGWYACMFATKSFGFVHGSVTNCNAQNEPGILVTASDGPFFTHTASDGTWAVPSLSNKPATVYFTEEDGDCSGSTSDPVTDEDNPKDDNDGDTNPNNDPFDDPDNTDSVDAGDDEMEPTDDSAESLEVYDFEDQTFQGFSCTGSCAGISGDEVDTFFPDGESYYLYLTSGGDQNPSCTCSATFQVPAGATELAISYDFMSQEWEEWAFSPYNDIFTAIIQGEYDYVINRTIDNVALDDDWADISLSPGFIATGSPDAQYNPTSTDPHSTGPYNFDGHLRWGASASDTPRGSDETPVGQVASYAVEAGSTITLLLTVSDVGDKIYDSAAVVDWVEFR